MPADDAHTFDLSVGPFDATMLRCTRIEGRERMHRSFVFDVWASLELGDGAHLVRESIGQRAELVLRGAPPSERRIVGVAERVDLLGLDERGGLAVRVRVVPRLAARRLVRGCRVFQDMPTAEIARRVLSASGIDVRVDLRDPPAIRPYCVQYLESDDAFVRRILAEDGLLFTFDHAAPAAVAESVLVFDSRDGYPELGSPRAFAYRPSDARTEIDETVQAFTLRRALAPGRITVREYDFLRPSHQVSLEAEDDDDAAFDERALRVYDHHDELESGEPLPRIAQRDLEQLRASAIVAHGSTRSVRLEVGRRFVLAEHAIASLDGEWVPTEIRHRWSAPRNDVEGATAYRAVFRCVPRSVTFRPPKPRRRLQQVVETAVVTGPPGEDIHVDDKGRIKVQFHWDEEGRRTDQSSCWIRVAQAWAGAGFGHQFIPRVGTEVLVSFLRGDVDKPVVVGSLYNTEHPVPFQLPTSKTKSGIRTQSTPGLAGYNELSFEDQAGHERVLLKAERDLEEHAQNDRLDRVGRDAVVVVGNNANRTVNGASNDVVQGSRSTMTLGPAVEYVMGGLQRTIEASESSITSGSRAVTITGADTLTVLGDRSTTVGASTVRINGDATTTVLGTATLDVEAAVRARFTDVLDVDVADSITMKTGRTLDIEAGDSLVLRCGGSRIEMRDGQIDIIADTVRVQGSDVEITGGTAVLKLQDNLTVTAENVSIQSSAAELALDTSATLKGGAIKLASGGGASSSADDAQSSSESSEPPKLDVAVWVGAGNESTVEGDLVVLDREGRAAETRSPNDAVARGGGMLTWAFDPATLPDPATIEWRPTHGRVRVVFGPASPTDTRAHLDAGRVLEARSAVGLSGRRKPRVDEAPTAAATRSRTPRDRTPSRWVDPPTMRVGRAPRRRGGVQITDVASDAVEPHRESEEGEDQGDNEDGNGGAAS